MLFLYKKRKSHDNLKNKGILSKDECNELFYANFEPEKTWESS